MTELEELETRYLQTQRELWWLGGQIHRIKLKQESITPEEREESLKQCRKIGSKVKNYKEVGE